MSKWRDATGYSRGDKERIPQTWEWGNKRLQICVTHKVYDPDGWYLICHQVDINDRMLSSKELEKAKSEAFKIVRDKLNGMLDELKHALSQGPTP